MNAAGAAPPPRLREDLDTLQVLVQRTAAHLGIDRAFVEKDFWVTELLRAVAAGEEVATPDDPAHPVRTVFKGGTSLSRVHHLIDRFSEDVDILVVFPDGIGLGAKDKVLKRIGQRALMHLGLGADRCQTQESTRGVKRNLRYYYPRRSQNPAAREYLLLEMGSRGGPDPHQGHAMRSLVAEYAASRLDEGPETWEEFAPVTVEVLAPERTLLEKLALLHDLGARFAGEESARDRMAQAGRHFYDVHRLLADGGVRGALRALGTAGVAALVDDIDDHSQAAGWSYVRRPPGGFADSPAFDPEAPGLAVAERSYGVAMAMVHGDRPTFQSCLTTVRRYRELI